MIKTRFALTPKFASNLALGCGALAMVLSGGCTANRSHEMTQADEPAATNVVFADDTMQQVHPAPVAIDVAFTTLSTTPNIKGDPSTALIGLYGELVGTNPDAGAQFDGQSNLTQVSFATEGACIDPDIDRTGSMMVFASTMHRPTADVYIKSVNGKTCTQLTADPADDVMPCFSPDGQSIAFASSRSGNWDLFTVGVNGGRPVQITSDNDPELHATWSPDGRTIAYCKFGTQSSRWEIWTVDVTNTSAPRFLEYGVFPRWNPDPARPKILFQRAKQRGSRHYSIWTIDLVAGQSMNPTEIVSASNAALINPAWSTDGCRIVFVSVVDPDQDPGAAPSQSDLWVVNIDGTERTNLTNGRFANFQPVWASNDTVYFVSNRSGADNIWSVSASIVGLVNSENSPKAVTPIEPDSVVAADAQNSSAESQP